jgi:nucleoside-diphosphate-sugar epimerase
MPISLDDATRAWERVFITGASGFMGAALAERYRAAGVEVRGVDLAADAERGVVAGDITEAGTWTRHVESCDLVVHTAAIVTMEGDADRMWRVNVLGTRNALDAAVAAGAKRFVHVSSVVTFGFDYPDGVDEHWPVRTNGAPYVDTKVNAEHVALQAHSAGEISCSVVRPGDVYGPRSTPWTVLPAAAARAGLRILPQGMDGTINPVFIDNLLDGLLLAAAEPAAVGQVVTVSEGHGMSVQDFFENYARMAGNVGAERPAAELDEGTLGFLTKSGHYSIDKARRLLGYEPRVSFEDGMARTEKWLRSNDLI